VIERAGIFPPLSYSVTPITIRGAAEGPGQWAIRTPDGKHIRINPELAYHTQAELFRSFGEHPAPKASDAAKPNTELLSDLQPELPGDARVFQMLSVVEDWQHDHKIHVAISDSWDLAKSWGIYLGCIAEVIAREYPQLEGGLDAIRDGFIEHFAHKPPTLDPPDAP
jgi:hypothetical protein